MPRPNKVLIVDDNPEAHHLLTRTLSPLEYEIASAHNGPQALEQIEAEQPSVVILDIMLPEPNGMEIFKQIHEREVKVEVIILTAHASLETSLEALELGAYDYITKPFQIDEIRSTVRQAMEKRRLEDNLTAVYDLSRDLALTRDTNQVTEAVLDFVQRTLEFEICHLWLIDKEQDELYCAAFRKPNRATTPRLLLDGEQGIVVAAAHSGEPIYVPETREDPRYVAIGKANRSELAVPLKMKGHVIGVLNVESAKVDAFSLEDERILSTLAAQAAVTMENAHLHEQAQQEISERKQAEEALRESEERFRDVALSTSDWVWEIDAQGHYTYCSEKVVDVIGYTAEEVLGQTPFDFMPEEEATRFSKIFDQIMAERQPIVDLENRNVTKDGHEVHLLTNGVPILDEEGTPIGYRGVDQDITERVQAEAMLRRQNRELATLNEIAQTVNSTLDLQETLTFIAERTIQLLGVEATSVLLYDEEEDNLRFAAASGRGADVIQGQRLTMGQGIAGWVAQHGEPALVPDISKDPRWFGGFDETSGLVTRSLLCVPLRSKGHVIGALEAVNKKSDPFDQRDLRLLSLLAEPAATAIENARLFERVRANREQLRALSRRLVDVQETERGRVARELHDEIGQALTSLLLSLSVMEGAVDDPLAVITHINQLEGLIDRTLKNLDRLAMDLRPASLDHLGLRPALEHYIEVLGEQSDITTRFEAIGFEGKRLSPAVEAALYRIVQEALTNVLRHSQATCVDVLLERRGDQVITLVEDDGIGFDPDAVLQQSTRLGLFGMQERAEMVGGSLTIESVSGGGTTIVVEVPYVQTSEE